MKKQYYLQIYTFFEFLHFIFQYSQIFKKIKCYLKKEFTLRHTLKL